MHVGAVEARRLLQHVVSLSEAVLQQQRARILGQRLRSSDTRSDGGEGGNEHDSERHPRRGMSSRAVSTLGTVPS